MNNPYMPFEAKVIDYVKESRNVFTLHLRFTDPKIHESYTFQPGQFNMLYLYGVGEVAISIVSDPEQNGEYQHTIRAVGRVTKGLAQLKVGDYLGVRGPYGRGWPLEEAKGKDVVVVTGGLGCAPVVSVINYILQRKDQYGALTILQGVKHSDDFIFHERFKEWQTYKDVEVYVAADSATQAWPFYTGYVTNFINKLELDTDNTLAMMCGPEGMMHVAIKALVDKGLQESTIYLSMERNMKCAVGHCGHCQYGGLFVCKDGPIFPFADIKALFSVDGF